MIRFTPEWVTVGNQPINTTPVVEGSAFSFQFEANDVARATVAATPTLVFQFGAIIGAVTAVYVNDILVDPANWTASDLTVTVAISQLNIPAGTTVAVSIYRAGTITYSHLAGDLPPGLFMDSGGLIEGFLGSVTDSTFTFLVRASNGSRVADRTFEITTVEQRAHQSFVPASMPPLETDPTGTFDYVSLGHFARADPLSTTFDVTTPQTDNALTLMPTGLAQSTKLTFFEGLPPGIALHGLSITGTIAGDATAGRYLFKVGIAGQVPDMANTTIVEIIVDNRLSEFVERPLVIEWITASGSLGEVVEGYPLHFYIEATSMAGPVTYTLAPASLSLPAGCRLNSTGELEGVAPHVNDHADFQFTVRASRDGNFVDRAFSFRVTNVYTTTQILDVRLRFRSVDVAPLTRRYTSLITSSALYRPSDPSFGLPSEPYIYLIKGISAAPFAAAIDGDDPAAITPNKDYHGPITLVLGEHDYAVVRNADGSILYEVVYRILYDQQAKAGGFSFTTNEVTEVPVIHAQSHKIVYPLSLRNARMDLVKDCRFPATDQSLERRIGLNTAEALPEWMASPQEPTDPNSALGFVSGMVVANVLPGQGRLVMNALNEDSVLGAVGQEVILDRYYIYEISYGIPTSFDETATTFDQGEFGHVIRFDNDINQDENPIKV